MRIAGSWFIPLVLFGCAPSPRNGGADIDSGAAPPSIGECPTPSMLRFAAPEPFPPTAAKNLDSLIVVLDSLDRRVAAARDVELPALLFARGKAKSHFRVMSTTPNKWTAYADQRPSEFRGLEPDASIGYTGIDFQELLRRFPESDLADDAAFALLSLPKPGECEEYTCGFSVWWPDISRFLRRYPESPHADVAVQRALVTFDVLDRIPDFHVPTDMGLGQVDATDIRGWIASLDSVAAVQTTARRTRLFVRVGELWKKLGDRDRAAGAYRLGMTGADAATRRCLSALIPE